jgi:peptidoglycan/xylan/chitin deacetylase (PgdA/CDA1 family)
MTTREEDPAPLLRYGAALPHLALWILAAASLLYLFSACASLPEPDRPVLPEIPGMKDTLPWFSIYPARWYGNSQAACSITFDDGTLDQYLIAAPELDARDIKGTFFIITGPRADGYWQDGNTNRLLFSWDQARDLKNRGHEIASHTANHIDLRAHPQLAEIEIREAYETLRRELSLTYLFSLGWPYWRSSPTASEQARRFHYAARAGGIQGAAGSPQLGGAKGIVPEDYMMIGSRAILSTDTMAKLAPVFDEVHNHGGWLVPSFHGIDDGLIPTIGLGWEALRLETFQSLLDGLSGYGFWFAPFGTVAKYAMQREGMNLGIKQDGTSLILDYSSPLDPAIFNHKLTLVIELPLAFRLESVVDSQSGWPLSFQIEDPVFAKRYLVDLPPGAGTLLVTTCQEPL